MGGRGGRVRWRVRWESEVGGREYEVRWEGEVGGRGGRVRWESEVGGSVMGG